ncbi:hypothetical protein V8C34DRAFT_315330 [Trichoderma compactum]
MQITLPAGCAACSSVQKLDALVTPMPGKVKDLPSRPLRTDGLRELHVNVPLSRLASFIDPSYLGILLITAPPVLWCHSRTRPHTIFWWNFFGLKIHGTASLFFITPSWGALEHAANGGHAATRPVSNISQSNDCPKSIDRFLATLSCDGGVTACDYDMSGYCVTGMLIPPIQGIIMQTVSPLCFTLRHISSSAQLIACSTKYTPPVTLVYACQERHV